jgi:type II pantothenate kinase
MFANNIAQIACLLAEREGVENIIFSGGFIRDNAYVWSKISFGLDFWSGSQRQALFVDHEGYLGALGAYLLYEGADAAPTAANGGGGGGGGGEGKGKQSAAFDEAAVALSS